MTNDESMMNVQESNDETFRAGVLAVREYWLAQFASSFVMTLKL